MTQKLSSPLGIQVGLHPNFNELVYQPRKNLSYFKVVRSFHVNNARVRVFVADHPTDMEKFFDVGVSAKSFDTVNKASFLFKNFRIFQAPRVVNKEFQGNPKKRAGSAGRKVNDALRLSEDFFCVFRHFLDRAYALLKRPNNRLFIPKCGLLTGQALCNAEIVITMKKALPMDFLAFNRTDITKCFNPAMRASI